VIRLGDTLSGSLASGDQAAPHRAGQYADFYQLTIAGQSPVNIDMKSADVNAYVCFHPLEQCSPTTTAAAEQRRIGALLSQVPI
jgi:hypothetical protein